MLLSVHTNLKALAPLAARAEHARFGATTCVRLIDPGNGLYRAEATDGRVLAVVQGPSSPLGPDPNPALTQALIPAEEWGAGLRLDKKAASVLITSDGEPDVSFHTPAQTRRVRQGEGRFPDVNRVLPAGVPLFAVRVDALLLAELLKVAAAFLPEGERGVQLLYYGKDRPLGLCTRNEQGQAFDALIVPLVIKEAA